MPVPLRLAALAAALAFTFAAPVRAAEPWEDGEPRLFLASRVEAGLHGRVLTQAGFGRPHWAWAGAQAAALVTPTCTGVAAGVRAALPFLDLGVSLRRTRSFGRPLLAARDSHVEAELSGGHARLTVLDADLSGVLPAPGGLVSWEVEWVRPLGLAAGTHVFEEIWQVALAPRGAGAVRVGWLAGPLLGRVRLGPFGEAVRLFGREDGMVWRAGGAVLVALGRHLSAVAMALVPLAGPDRFDTLTATYGTVAFRYDLASGDRAPGFP